jgi:hypothetical protein
MSLRIRSGLALPAILILSLAGASGPVTAANPPGNNGTIKVDAQVLDVLPDNEPHPSCTFGVDFYGFDAGALYATATFTVVAPSASTDTDVFTSPPVWIGQDSNDGGGSATGIDLQQTFDLNAYLFGYMGSSSQGAHVRLTVHADGATNADTKYKTFWVTGCVEPPPPPPQDT